MSLRRLVLLLLPLLALSLFPVLSSAQQMGGSNMSITGCLKQGSDAGGFYLMAQDGKMYEVIGHGVNLAEHVGHTVTVTGHSIKLTEKEEAKKEASEKVEAGNASFVDFQATGLKMVSTSCQ